MFYSTPTPLSRKPTVKMTSSFCSEKSHRKRIGSSWLLHCVELGAGVFWAVSRGQAGSCDGTGRRSCPGSPALSVPAQLSFSSGLQSSWKQPGLYLNTPTGYFLPSVPGWRVVVSTLTMVAPTVEAGRTAKPTATVCAPDPKARASTPARGPVASR